MPDNREFKSLFQPVTRCVTLTQWVKLSKLQFSYEKNVNNNSNFSGLL